MEYILIRQSLFVRINHCDELNVWQIKRSQLYVQWFIVLWRTQENGLVYETAKDLQRQESLLSATTLNGRSCGMSWIKMIYYLILYWLMKNTLVTTLVK